MKKLLLIITILISLSGFSQIRIDQTKSVSSAGTITIGKTIVSNGSGGWTFEDIAVGDITGVAAGTGLTGGGTSGDVTLDLSLGELTNDNTAITIDYVPWIDVGTSSDKKMTIATLGTLVGSKWTSDTYGISSTNNVGIGAASAQYYKLYSLANVADYGAKISNTNTSGKGLLIQGGSALSHAFSITPYGGGSLSYFNIFGNGVAQMYQATAGTATAGHGLLFVDTDDKIKWKTSTTTYDLTATGSGMSNPMTTTGDIIYASTTGTPSTATRLGIGADGYVLTVSSGIPVWGTAPNNSGWTDNGSAVNLTTQTRVVGIGTAADVSKKINVLSSSGHGIYSFNNVNISIEGNTTSGTGVKGLATTGTGVYGEATGIGGTAVYGIASGSSGTGLWGKSTHSGGFGFIAQNSGGGYAGMFNVEPASANTVQKVVSIQRLTTGTAAIGIGSSFEFETEIANGTGPITGKLEHYLQNVTAGAESSEFRLTTINGGTLRPKVITAQFNIVRFSTGTYTTTEETGTVINQGGSSGFILDASPQHGQTHTLINQYISPVSCSTYYNLSNTLTVIVAAMTSITVQYDSSDSKWYRIQ